MSPWFWFAFVSIIIGLGLTWYASIRALNSAFSKKEEHGLFWAGTAFLTVGIIMLMVIFFSYVKDNTNLKKDIEILTNKIYDLNNKLGQCSGKGGSSGPSGPGFFSRIGSKIGGWFGRNTSVPAAGNTGEVNPFRIQE